MPSIVYDPPVEKLKTASINDIRNLSGIMLSTTERSKEWDDIFISKINEFSETNFLVLKLKNNSIINNRENDTTIINEYNSLLSDSERIGVFMASTSIEENALNDEKPRLKAIFLFLGPHFQEAHKRAKDGYEIKPIYLSEIQGADKTVNFVRGK